MRVGLLALFLLAPGRAWGMYDSKLDLGRSDTQLHMGLSFAGAFAASEFLEWRKWPTWKATLAGSLLGVAACLVKEYAVDDRASGNDLMADGIGLGANAVLQFSVRF